jgi:sialate O-acetylesterase
VNIQTTAGAILVLIFAHLTTDAIQPAGVFSDSMVVQRNRQVPIWGWGTVGETVTVSFNGQSVTATARDSTVAAYKGYWKARLQPMAAGGPFDMTILGSQSGGVTLHGLLVGDVWIGSGQSNMWYTFNGQYFTSTSPEVMALPPDGSPNTQIRMCIIGIGYGPNPALDLQQNPAWSTFDNQVTAPWRSCSRTATLDFSACAGDFAVMLYAKVHVPLGVIVGAVPSTGLRKWVAPELADSIWYKQCNNYDSTIRRPPPVRYTTVNSPYAPGGCFSSVINPLVGMAITGVIWWQGENESGFQADPVCDYTTGAFRELIRDWRARWGQGNFAFLWVQMQQSLDGNATANINEVRDQQQQCLTEPNTGMCVYFDSANQIHPFKYIPGVRLAKAAAQLVYGQAEEGMGPIYSSMSIAGNAATIKFVHTGGGLVKHDLVWFEGDNNLAVGANVISSSSDPNAPFKIAGVDNIYHPADATISGNAVVVSSPLVSAPKNVHYGVEIPNPAKTPLYNTANLPASMFRTDTWGGLAPTQSTLSNRLLTRAGVAQTTRSLIVVDDKVTLPKRLLGSRTAIEIYDVKGNLIARAASGKDRSIYIRKNAVHRQTIIMRMKTM